MWAMSNDCRYGVFIIVSTAGFKVDADVVTVTIYVSTASEQGPYPVTLKFTRIGDTK